MVETRVEAGDLEMLLELGLRFIPFIVALVLRKTLTLSLTEAPIFTTGRSPAVAPRWTRRKLINYGIEQ